ncbi:hypothetical protein Syun_008082 [Stephania yunnanensis]|uniref:INO80 complex subunit B-like conserved region domain-containing protein n=1 Tax=Stephania yunnanensis TaxID=152371 RepID=A0AAP0Q315_9MAGN
MEGFGGSGINCFASGARKKRTNLYRRPQPELPPLPDSCGTSLLSSTPSIENVDKISSSESGGSDSGAKQLFDLNARAAGVRSFNGNESETGDRRNGKDGGSFGGLDDFYMSGGSRGSDEKNRSNLDFKRCTEGALAPASRSCINKVKECFETQSINPNNQLSSGTNDESRSLGHMNGSMNEGKLRKVKLIVGGVTRTIHAKSTFDVASGDGPSSFKSYYSSDSPESQQKLVNQGTVNDGQSSLKKVNGLQGVPWKNFAGGSFSLRKDTFPKAKMPENKTKHVHKRHVWDKALDDSDEDVEIQYLEKLKHSRKPGVYSTEFLDDEEEGSRKQRRISSVLKSRTGDVDYGDRDCYSSKTERYRKQSRPVVGSGSDAEYEDEMASSDSELEAGRKKQKKEPVDSSNESKREILSQRVKGPSSQAKTCLLVTTLNYSSSTYWCSMSEQKEMLTEVEKQLKKAEAAQRRRMQAERAAKESEAAAIRKILGQDSNMRKREDRTKKRRDEIAQDKAANATVLASNSIRWIMGPSGTVVVFPIDMNLPSIFNSKPCRSESPPIHSRDLTIPLLAKPVLVLHARIHTSIAIPNQSFLSAAFSATRPYMNRNSQYQPSEVEGSLCPQQTVIALIPADQSKVKFKAFVAVSSS